jgi:hypothetical protein
LPGLVRRLHRYYGTVRLPALVHRRRVSSDFPTRPVAPSAAGQDLPVLVRSVSVRARGLRPRGTRLRLAISTHPVSPSAYLHGVGAPKQHCFRGSIPGPHVPLSTLRCFPCGKLRMTRGRRGSLALQHTTLSFATLRRFIPAHGGHYETHTHH